MERYEARGVSSKKTEVHQAIQKVDPGIFPTAFCKITEDYLGNNPNYCNIMHADGSGTKSSVAYLVYKETGDASVFEGIAQDAIVMNTDDLLCVGATENLLMSSTIGRNAKLVDARIIQTLIDANERICAQLTDLGLQIRTTGGETADVGDLVRTVIVDTTVIARIPKANILTNADIQPGHIIVGLASAGKTTYESQYNSGIGSNGLTSARHELLHHDYRTKYPETFDPNIDPEFIYNGPHHINSPLPGTPLTIGQAILSPTRTYAPIIKPLLAEHRGLVSGIIHCSGGGQTKCLRFGQQIRYIKDNLFEAPPIFTEIQKAANTPWKEMYQVFNMGHRMEVIGTPEILPILQSLGDQYELEVQQIGVCERSNSGKNELRLESNYGRFEYGL